jgi:hypothetical protein
METELRAGKKSTARKLVGSTLGLVGFLLSPLSWWNDLVVNIPLALAFAWLLSLLFPAAFLKLAILGYWLSNVLGLYLMHRGALLTFTKGEPPAYTWKSALRDFGVALLYTLVIILVIKLGWIHPPDQLINRD